jgi:hypothetical protein
MFTAILGITWALNLFTVYGNNQAFNCTMVQSSLFRVGAYEACVYNGEYGHAFQ